MLHIAGRQTNSRNILFSILKWVGEQPVTVGALELGSGERWLVSFKISFVFYNLPHEKKLERTGNKFSPLLAMSKNE